MKIYLATSWKNQDYTQILGLLRHAGHDVYDYREKGFLFSQLVKPGINVDAMHPGAQYGLLENPIAKKAFRTDYDAMMWADVIVMLYPCGNDAHVELGWFAGQGKSAVIYVKDGYKVGLMDLVGAPTWVFDDQQLLQALR